MKGKYMICRKCKSEIPDGSKYCLYCGACQSPGGARRTSKRPNGTGTVYKRSDMKHTPWVAAKNKVVIGYFDTKAAAYEALERLAGKDVDERYNMTFADVYDAWRAEYFGDIAQSARQAYETAYKAFAPLHDQKFRLLRTGDFQSVIDDNRDRPSTVRRYRQFVNQLSKWAMREEVITTNFAQFVKVPPVQRKEKAIFTDEEIARIDSDGSEAARIVSMLLATGMRISELFALKLSDYHGKYVVGGSKTEAGKNRVIPIRPEGQRHFEYFAYQSAGMEHLLDSYVGNKIPKHFRSRDYNALLTRLGIDKAKTPHTTRHTYASRAVKEGMPPEMLQKILGHVDYSTTANIYTHIDAETLVAAVYNSCGYYGVTT